MSSADNHERDVLEYDVVVVGAGPAGLACALRLKQQAPEKNICVLDKASQIGAHTLSGAVLQVDALDELVPEWREDPPAVCVDVIQDDFKLLTETSSYRLPLTAQMKNHGNVIISLGALCGWLAEKAEAAGVDVLPGFSAVDALIENKQVVGVRTGDMGIDKTGNAKATYTPGVDIRAAMTVLAEGCRGSLSKKLIAEYELDKNSCEQTYGIGFKELWQVPEGRVTPGHVQHTIGWPLSQDTYGGGFLYHLDNNRVAIGFVIGLDYSEPDFQPFECFQQFKHHPDIQPLLQGGEIISSGARSLIEGGIQALPKLDMPGALLIGDAAGMLNVAKIKGVHMALRAGMMAAEHLVKNTTSENFDAVWRKSKSASELQKVRNIRPGFRWGLWGGLINAALETITGGRLPWTLKHHRDSDSLKRLADFIPASVKYVKRSLLPRDRLNAVYYAAIAHEEDQPVHLQIQDSDICINKCTEEYGNPCRYFCPAQVYEMTANDQEEIMLQINAANCLHCKVCDIKDPYQIITWVPPEGASGPNYQNM